MNKSRLPHLLPPFDLRGLPLRNRVVLALTRVHAGRERLPGGVLSGEPPLDPTKVTSAGFLISHKQAGPFQLEVARIKVTPRARR